MPRAELALRHLCFLLIITASLSWLAVAAVAQPQFELPDSVAVRPVTIWSEGTRVAGDLYSPKARSAADDELPAIVMSHGWGATKALLVRNAATFAANGFIVLAFDYRGWATLFERLISSKASPVSTRHGLGIGVRATLERMPSGWQPTSHAPRASSPRSPLPTHST